MAQIKITVEIVATNVVASRPPNGDRLQCRPLVPIEKVESFYATIKPKKKKHSQSKETLDIITEIDTEQNKNIEATTKGKPIITTHTDFVEKVAKRLQNNQIELPKRQPTSKGEITGWIFDKNPLHTHDMK